MRLDLLWFRHQRPPRPHVAEPRGDGPIYGCHVVALDSLYTAMNTPFAQLLDGHWVVRDEETRRGQYFEHEGRWRRAHVVEVVDTNDWFAPPRWRVLITPPVSFTTAGGSAKVAWLEDEMFPRIGGHA